jgi:hypothetical protein
MLARLATLASGLAVAGCAVFGDRSGTAEPAFIVLARHEPIEIRQYGPRLAAETTVEADEEAARNEGFRRLAGYIFGANTGSAKIAMTAPVAQAPQQGTTIAMTAPVAQAAAPSTAAGQGGWVVRFFMPAEWTMATLPTPNDPAVRLVEIPGETMAVLRFTGSRAPAAVTRENAALLRALDSGPWQPTGEPVAWFYDPPWTLPWLRRNEVAVPVAPR